MNRQEIRNSQPEQAGRRNLTETFGKAVMIAEYQQHNYNSARLDHHLASMVISRMDHAPINN